MDLITALWFGFVGACVGSFLNVVAYRMPLGLSVVWQPSRCPNCKRPIRPYDNVPILGWLWLRGRCRDCQAPISPRYAVVETVVGAVFFLLAYGEVFSGGLNLHRGPLTDLTGAWHTVWNPYWPLLVTYAVHVTLMALLTVLVLFSLDEMSAPRRFIGVAVALLAGAAIAAPGVWRHAVLAPGVDEPQLAGALVVLALGAAPGASLAWMSRRRAAKRSALKSPAAAEQFNAAIAVMLLGMVVGLRGLATATLPGLAALALFAAQRGRSGARRAALSAAVWIAALVQILFWRPLIDWLWS
ncbi:MAG: hypothetical protein CMJ58_17200 [Planctomycetaceae bacterium]|nr:hypothetical protein [Planctomycetaceae bacterium]